MTIVSSGTSFFSASWSFSIHLIQTLRRTLSSSESSFPPPKVTVFANRRKTTSVSICSFRIGSPENRNGTRQPKPTCAPLFFFPRKRQPPALRRTRKTRNSPAARQVRRKSPWRFQTWPAAERFHKRPSAPIGPKRATIQNSIQLPSPHSPKKELSKQA